MRLFLLAALALAHPTLALAQTAPDAALRQRVEAALASAPAGTRFGLLVVDDKGREVLAINPDQRFIPASNTKLFTTALAFDTFAANPDAALRGGISFVLLDHGKGAPDLLIRGEGGAVLSTAPDCTQHCLASYIDKVAASSGKIGDVIADDTAFPDQRWSPGMSWNNIQTDSGTATSALLFDDAQLLITAAPGKVGEAPVVTLSPYYTQRNEAVTGPEGSKTTLGFERAPNSRVVRIFGSIAAGQQPWRDLLGIDDPAHYAAWAAQQALLARGVKVKGTVRVLHRTMPAPSAVAPALAGKARIAWAEAPVALADEVSVINKRSQNLHAEVLLRRAGAALAGGGLFTADEAPVGSREAGLKALEAMLGRIGIARTSYDFADGSGMSSYNRVSPRAGVALLRWAARQPWAAVWRASLPIGGQDGTLRRRFVGTPLQGKLFAKTGTLNATNALSGYLIAASGRELTFAAFANDVPGDVSAAGAIDAALGVIAAAN